MKYKVGDKVRVVSILKAGEKYGDKKFTKCMEKYRGEVVTISKVYCNRYCIKEDYEGWYWTDEMFEGLAEDELTAEEAIKIQAEMCTSIMCKDCAIDRLRCDSRCGCDEFRSKNPDKVLEVLKKLRLSLSMLSELLKILETSRDVCMKRELTLCFLKLMQR